MEIPILCFFHYIKCYFAVFESPLSSILTLETEPPYPQNQLSFVEYICLTLTASWLLDVVQQTTRRGLVNLDIGRNLIPTDSIGINVHIIPKCLGLQSSHRDCLWSIHVCSVHIKIDCLRALLTPLAIIENLHTQISEIVRRKPYA